MVIKTVENNFSSLRERLTNAKHKFANSSAVNQLQINFIENSAIVVILLLAVCVVEFG